MLRGIPVNDETLGLDMIHKAGLGGHFLTEEHTIRHTRTTQWRPTLISREGHDQWQQSGALSLRQRARQKALRILRDYTPPSLPTDKVQNIKHRVERFQKVIRDDS
ncbi:MAG: hypothetical protein GTN81_16705 [Proteobacteria bacterium]|nr:hypothetical protein [Pseudomonadota bacterium]